jgi:hypothetical protein
LSPEARITGVHHRYLDDQGSYRDRINKQNLISGDPECCGNKKLQCAALLRNKGEAWPAALLMQSGSESGLLVRINVALKPTETVLWITDWRTVSKTTTLIE